MYPDAFNVFYERHTITSSRARNSKTLDLILAWRAQNRPIHPSTLLESRVLLFLFDQILTLFKFHAKVVLLYTSWTELFI